jgi:hypothetical protein
MRIFHKKWREKLDTYAKNEWKQERKPGKVNPFALRRGQVPLEFFKKPRNAQEKRKYIKKYGKFLPWEKDKRMRSINPLDNIDDELLLRDYVQYYGVVTLDDLKKNASFIKGNLDIIKRPNVRKEMEELLKSIEHEIYWREWEKEMNKVAKRKRERWHA